MCARNRIGVFVLLLLFLSLSYSLHLLCWREECVFLINLAQRSQGDEFKCLSIYVGVVFYVVHHIFLFCILDSVSSFCSLHFAMVGWLSSVARTFCGTLFCHYTIVIATRTHHHFQCISVHVNESLEKKRRTGVVVADIKMKLKFKTEKYFVRLNGRQGVAGRKKQMNVCKWLGWIYFNPEMKIKLHTRQMEINSEQICRPFTLAGHPNRPINANACAMESEWKPQFMH